MGYIINMISIQEKVYICYSITFHISITFMIAHFNVSPSLVPPVHLFLINHSCFEQFSTTIAVSLIKTVFALLQNILVKKINFKSITGSLNHMLLCSLCCTKHILYDKKRFVCFLKELMEETITSNKCVAEK